MLEAEGAALLPLDNSAAQLLVADGAPGDGTAWALSEADSDLNPVLDDRSDEWILPSFSVLSPVEPGVDVPGTSSMEPDAGGDGEEIVINGPRFHYGLGGGGGSGGGATTGGSGGGDGGTGGGGSGGGTGATGVETHEQDCATEDGAAVQVARAVKGMLPSGTSGPEDPLKTSSGKDWTQVEFGALIIQNADGSFGAFNNMIYSNDWVDLVLVPFNSTQPIQGLWHSHPSEGDSFEQQMINRYPSPADWYELNRIATSMGTGSNPSLWIMGPDGVTREFKLSERSYFATLAQNESRMVAGEGLDGRERAESCG